jgi:hypothetical protein
MDPESIPSVPLSLTPVRLRAGGLQHGHKGVEQGSLLLLSCGTLREAVVEEHAQLPT